MTNVDTSAVTDEQKAQIIREERDRVIRAYLGGRIKSVIGVEELLNARIRGLGVETTTGDSTVSFSEGSQP